MFEGFVDETVGPRVVGLTDLTAGAELADHLLAAELLAPVAEAGDHSPAGERAWQVASAEGLARLEGWSQMTAWVQAQEMISIEALVSRAVERAERRPPGTLLDDAVGGVSAEVDSVVAELALVWQVAQRTAARRVDEAVSLVSGLPLLVEAMLDGRLGLAHVRAVGGVLLDLDPELRERLCRDLLEGTPAGRSIARTPAQLAGSARRAAVRLDPSSARRRERAAARVRGVHLGAEDHGMATVTAYLPAAEALLLYRTLDAHARRADPVDPGPASVEDAERSPDARRADALCDLVALGALAAAGALPAEAAEAGRDDVAADEARSTGAADAAGASAASGAGASGAGSARPTSPGSTGPTGAPGRSGSARPVGVRPSAAPTHTPTRRPRDVQIRVVVPADTLLGLDDRPAELVGYGPVTAETARALAAGDDATWRRILTDPATGAVLDVGHQRYRPPAAMAEHVRNRDLTCTFPGCRVPAQACDLDHLVPYGPDEGSGRTAVGNLGPECRHHHRIKHLPGWAVARGPDGSVLWTTPSGRRYRTVRPVLLPVTADEHAPVASGAPPPGRPDEPDQPRLATDHHDRRLRR